MSTGFRIIRSEARLAAGTLRLAVRDNNTIRDLFGNPLGGPRLGDGDNLGLAVYRII